MPSYRSRRPERAVVMGFIDSTLNCAGVAPSRRYQRRWSTAPAKSKGMAMMASWLTPKTPIARHQLPPCRRSSRFPGPVSCGDHGTDPAELLRVPRRNSRSVKGVLQCLSTVAGTAWMTRA